MATHDVVLAAVGDVVLARDDPACAFQHVRDELARADVRVCNLEVPLSNEGMPQYSKLVTLHSSPEMVTGYVHAGFEVVSLANNHTMDYGPAALVDTMRLLDAHGIAHAGAGQDREAAWCPLLRQVNGATVGFVSFASEAFPGYGATATRPGIAMVRRDPLYGPDGVSPDDVAQLQASIRRARDEADWVVAFFHWGLSQSRQTTVSQRHLARAAIDAGADVVVGHHPHILQGLELYKDAPILYSLGNFVFDLRPHFFGPMTNATVIARIGLSSGAVVHVELLPVWIGDDGRPFRLPPQDERTGQVLAEIRRLSRCLGTDTALAADAISLVPTAR
ncbi:MAG: hypothetical protein GEU81_07705 [Nitriliruptorales bacterium]|nr:hypothetical protein [Nitriliruptorales bacterium]